MLRQAKTPIMDFIAASDVEGLTHYLQEHAFTDQDLLQIEGYLEVYAEKRLKFKLYSGFEKESIRLDLNKIESMLPILLTNFPCHYHSAQHCKIMRYFIRDIPEQLFPVLLNKIDLEATLDNEDRTALLVATFNAANIRFANYLIQHGANVTIADKYGNTVLHYYFDLVDHQICYYQFFFDQVLTQINCSEFINQKNSLGSTVLHKAVELGLTHQVNALVTAGADIFIKNRRGANALDFVFSHPYKIVTQLIKIFQANIHDSHQPLLVAYQRERFPYYPTLSTAFHVDDYLAKHAWLVQIQSALEEANLEAMRDLVKSEDRFFNEFILKKALESLKKRSYKVKEDEFARRKLIVIMLLDQFVKTGNQFFVDESNFIYLLRLGDQGKTLKCNDSVEFVDNLFTLVLSIANNANEIRDDYGNNLLMIAIQLGCPSCVEALLKEEGMLSNVNQFGFTPLHLLAKQNDSRYVHGSDRVHSLTLRQFIKSVKDPAMMIQHLDLQGRTALHLAASSGNEEMVDYLLENGVDIKIKDLQANTAIHVAAQGGALNPAFQRIAQKLLALWPDFADDPNQAQQTALSLAQMNGNHSLVAILQALPVHAIKQELTPSPKLK